MADGEWIANKTLLPVDPCPQNSTTVVTLMLDMNYSDLNDYDITIDEKKSMVIIIKKLTNLLNQKKKSAICYHCFELKIKQPRPEKRLQCNILSPKLLLLRQI